MSPLENLIFNSSSTGLKMKKNSSADHPHAFKQEDDPILMRFPNFHVLNSSLLVW